MTTEVPMNDMNETPAETPEAAEAPAAEATEAPAEETKTAPWFQRLRETGEVGKKQWETALERTRAFLAKRKAEAAPEAAEVEKTEAEAEVPEADVAEPEIAKPWARVREKSVEVFGKAQERGAGILLDVVVKLRARIEAVEASLKETRPEAEDVAAAA